MVILGFCRGYIGIVEQKMEATIQVLGFRFEAQAKGEGRQGRRHRGPWGREL